MPDCYQSNTIYNGKSSFTKTNKKCLSWSSFLNATYQDEWRRNVSKNGNSLRLPEFNDTEYRLFLPENDVQNVSNYCRQSAMFYRESDSEQWKDVSSMFLDLTGQSDSMKPWCIVDGEYGYVTGEECSVDSCGDSIKSTSRVLLDASGHGVLNKFMGHDLESSLLDCSIGGKVCFKSDFTTFSHPEIGTCFKFNGDTFLKGLTSAQTTDVKFDLKLYVDTHLFDGKLLKEAGILTGVMTGGNMNFVDLEGYYVILVPPGRFPFKKYAVDVTTATHTSLHYTYDKQTKLNTKTFKCAVREDSLPYKLPVWGKQQIPYGQYKDNQSWLFPARSVLDYYRRFDNVTLSFIRKRDDCINSFLIKLFATRCHCSPFHLVFDVDSPPLCYSNSTNKPGLLAKDLCLGEIEADWMKHVSNAEKECIPDCIADRYLIRQVTQAWPDTYMEGMLSTVNKLNDKMGFPRQVKPWKGISSMQYVYYMARDLLDAKTTTNLSASNDKIQTMVDALRSNLVWVTVKSFSSTGQETKEEEAYPLKNFMADLGGILGLWSGVSILTMFEFFELLVVLSKAIQLYLQNKKIKRRMNDNINMNNKVAPLFN